MHSMQDREAKGHTQQPHTYTCHSVLAEPYTLKSLASGNIFEKWLEILNLNGLECALHSQINNIMLVDCS